MNCFEGYRFREDTDEDKVYRTCNNLVIMRGNHSCVHAYDYPADQKEILIDFFRSAYLGSGDKATFMSERKGDIDAADFWKNFKRSYEGLKRLDPENYLEAIEIGRLSYNGLRNK